MNALLSVWRLPGRCQAVSSPRMRRYEFFPRAAGAERPRWAAPGSWSEVRA